MSDRSGVQISVTGELGNSRVLQNGKDAADLKIISAENPSLNSFGIVLMEALEIQFTQYDPVTRVTVMGHMDVDSGSGGRISIRLSHAGSSSITRYVGFCDAQFSAEPRKISK